MAILYQDDLFSVGIAQSGLVITFGEKPIAPEIKPPALGRGINLEFKTADESITVEIRRRQIIKTTPPPAEEE